MDKVHIAFYYIEPGPVRNEKAAATSDGPVVISWDPPFAKGGRRLLYVYSYGDTQRKTPYTSFTIPTDTQKKAYKVKVISTFDKTLRNLRFSFSLSYQ